MTSFLLLPAHGSRMWLRRLRQANRQPAGIVVRRASLIAILFIVPAFGQPKQWWDDFKTAATYDSASLYAPCFSGPSTKYTVIDLGTKAIVNERAVSGGGSLVFTNRSTVVVPDASGRVELAVIGVVDVGQPCPDNPAPGPGAAYVTSEPFTTGYPNNRCTYGGVKFTPWQLRHPPDGQSIRGPEGKCGVGDVDDDLDGTMDENDECLAARPTSVNSGYGNPDGTGFRGGQDAAPGVAGIDDDGNGITDDLDELGWPTSDDGDDTNRQGYGIAMGGNLSRGSLIYVGMDPGEIGDAFSMRHIVAGLDSRLEASNEIPQDFYKPYTHYNWVFCSSMSCYGAVLWTGTDLANPNETLGPLTSADHTGEADNVVAHMFFMRTTPPQFIRRQHVVGNSSFDHTFWVISGGTWDYFPSVSADFDDDKDVDGFDFLTFSKCYNGSDKPPLSACTNPQADLDEDGDVDGFDFLSFSNCYNASNRKPLAACFPPNLTACGS